MKRDIFFYTSLDFKNHPMKDTKINYREDYINALGYFINKYSKNEVNTEAVLKQYSKHFLNNDISYDNNINDKEWRKKVKKTCNFKIKKFKIFTYRFVFICDCLFINAFNNPQLGRKIIDEFKTLFSSRYHLALEELYEVLYNDKLTKREFKLAEKQIEIWKRNKNFINKPIKNILITATMSAGKSTLVNTIIGKKLAQTRNEACTDTANLFFNKLFEDELITKKNSNGEIVYDSNIINIKSQSEYSNICTYMNLINKSEKRICLIDTPGVNSSLNRDHADVTVNALNNMDYNKVVYVINANNIGTEDDMKHLKNICEIIKNKKIIFVLNKLDTFRLKEDSIEESIEELRKDLKNIGFKNISICPTSAYAAGLFKKLLNNEQLNEDEELDCSMLLRKFSKSEYDLSKFYDKECNYSILENKSISFEQYDSNKILDCLYKTGIINLEQLITEGEN
ncbi:GTP-binding protein [Clostridium botulinum]|uniref:GTP-binding protein n=1 Tax=Clostridium botulinum TaxID=1491 RepID=UPI0019672EA5|nr:hypothetical protein [Clostridium botulinum]